MIMTVSFPKNYHCIKRRIVYSNLYYYPTNGLSGPPSPKFSASINYIGLNCK